MVLLGERRTGPCPRHAPGVCTLRPLGSSRVCSMWMARQGEQKEDLAGGRSSRSSRRCCYLHYFHILQNKEQEAASNSGELGVRPVPRLSQSRGWSRQGAAPRTQRISVLMERTPAACPSSPRRKGIRTPHLSLFPDLLRGTVLKAPPPAPQTGQTDDFSPHPCISIVDAPSRVSPRSCAKCPLSRCAVLLVKLKMAL